MNEPSGIWQSFHGLLRVAAAAVACVMLALLGGCSSKQTEDTNRSVVENGALREELLRRAKEDQAIRAEEIKRGADKPDKSIRARMGAMSADNEARLEAIIKQYGWPAPALVEEDGANAAFVLVQHSGHAFQKKVLPQAKKAYESGQMPGPHYALLLDRVLVGDRKPQVYGTQARGAEQWKEHEPALYPIEDEANVDKRRAEMGLEPLSNYVSGLKRTYFPDSQSRTN